MSEQIPIYIYASDEEPSEDSFDSDAVSVHGDSPIHPRVTSDDSSMDTLPLPPTIPATQPAVVSAAGQTSRLFAESSRGPWMRRTPRMCVRDFPTGPLAPRGKAPMTEPATLPEEPSLRLRVPHLDWMPRVLREWRSLEGIPSTFETGESSHTPSHAPLTGEPLELTVPTLVAVIYTLFRISSGRGVDIRELRSDISRLDGDMASTFERFAYVEGNMIVAREIAESTRARLRLFERRARVAGIVVGICLMLAALMAAVGFYLPRLY